MVAKSRNWDFEGQCKHKMKILQDKMIFAVKKRDWVYIWWQHGKHVSRRVARGSKEAT